MISSRSAREALLRRSSDRFLIQAFNMHEQANEEHPFSYAHSFHGQAWRAGIYIEHELRRRGYSIQWIPGRARRVAVKGGRVK